MTFPPRRNSMRNILVAGVAVLSIILCHASAARACTTFTIKDKQGNTFFGRNFDYAVGDGHVTVNKRGVKKSSFIKAPEKPMTWVSKFGSVTFNLVGREFPCGGMNEAGLVVEMLRLANSTYPEMDGRFGLSVLQWIQYQLDNAKTVDEVITSDSRVRISQQSTTTNHFLVTDKTGNTAIIGYLDGKMQYYRGSDLPYATLTNSTYEESVKYIGKFAGFGGNETLPQKDESSLGRFSIAAAMVKKFRNDDKAIDYSFKILDSVWQLEKKEWNTQWSIVYDIGNLNIHFRTARNKAVRSIAFKDFDFGCWTSSRIIDVDKALSGAADFSDYSPQAHRDLIERVLNGVPALKNTPPERRDALARYPQTTSCSESK